MDDAFAELRFTEKSVRKIYKNTRKSVRKALPRQYADYDVRIITKGIAIENLIENEPEPPAYTDKPKRKKKAKPHIPNVPRTSAILLLKNSSTNMLPNTQNARKRKVRRAATPASSNLANVAATQHPCAFWNCCNL